MCTDQAQESFMTAVKSSEREDLIRIFGFNESDCAAKEVHYHKRCYLRFTEDPIKYPYGAKSNQGNEKKVDQGKKGIDDDKVYSLIEEQVLLKGIPKTLSSLHDFYITNIKVKGIADDKLIQDTRTFLSKINLHFSKRISTILPYRRIGAIVYDSSLSSEEAFRRFTYANPEDEIDMKAIVLGEEAEIMRTEIMDMKAREPIGERSDSPI